MVLKLRALIADSNNFHCEIGDSEIQSHICDQFRISNNIISEIDSNN